MKTPHAVRRIAFACVIVLGALAVGCQHESRPSLAPLSIRLETALGMDLRLVGLEITTQPDRRSWTVVLHALVLVARNPRPHVWVHAYPQGSSTYFTVDPGGTFPSMNVGQIVEDAFVLTRAGAFNMYAGITGADGSLGPAVGLGWIGVGDPDTPEYHAAYRFLQEADDTRAAAMLAQTQRAYPNARLP